MRPPVRSRTYEPGSQEKSYRFQGIVVRLRNGRESTDSSLCRAKREQVPPTRTRIVLWMSVSTH